MQTEEQIRRDVETDLRNDRDRATIQRRHPKAKTDAELMEAEVRQRLFLQTLPTMWSS